MKLGSRPVSLAASVAALVLAASGCGGGGGGGSKSCSTTGRIAVDVTALGTAFDYTQGTYLVGFRFKATSALTVTDLGYWDSNLEGSKSESFGATEVGLYDLTTSALLGSVTVVASDPATGFYRYHALTSPVSLGTSDTYAVVAVTGSNYYVSGVGPRGCAGGYACSGATSPCAIDVLGGACLGGGGDCLTTTTELVEPTDTSTWVNLGPNFKFSM